MLDLRDRLACRVTIGYSGLRFDVDTDPVCRRERERPGLRHHDRHRLPGPGHTIARQQVKRFGAVERQERIDGRHRQHPEFGRGEYRNNPGQKTRVASVDGQQPPTRVLTSHEGDVKRPVNPDVGREPATPGQEAIVLTAKRFE